jgi:hypothetical protein
MTKNILLCYFSIGGTSYYYDFAEELVENGNNVICWNLYTAVYSKNNQSKIDERISDFNPDLIFSYNNICPEQVIRITKAKVLLLDADNPEFFSNKEIINKYDFFYLGYQSKSKDLYKSILNADITDKNYLFFPTATNFKKDDLMPKDINISFIGSNFYRNFFNDRVITVEERDIMLSLSKKIKENYYFSNPDIDVSLINFTKYYLAGQDRLRHLSAISDLGLQIFSNSDWGVLFTYDFDLANCFNKKVVITKKENQDIYNSSKISVNLSHLQAVSSFSWRVPDIMASSACLIMENKVDWHMVYGDRISDYVKQAIIYKDQYDLREKSIKLLNDEDLRLRCVKESQQAIEYNGRWKSRIVDLESFLKIKLLNKKENNSKSENCINVKEIIVHERPDDIESNDIIEEASNDCCQNNSIDNVVLEPLESGMDIILNNEQKKKRQKTDIEIFFRCIILAIYFIPFIGKRIVKKKRVKGIINMMINR